MEALRHTFERQLAAALPGVEVTLERPKSGELGDLAFPCFRAAKQLGRNPAQLAQGLAGSISIEGATLVAAGPYLNLKLAPSCSEIYRPRTSFRPSRLTPRIVYTALPATFPFSRIF